MIEFIIIGALAIVIIIFLIFMSRTQNAIKDLKDNQSLTLMQQQIGQLRTEVTKQLQATTGQVGTRLDKAAEVIASVKKDLGGVFEATRQVFDIGKDIASLQELLRAPKFRGGFGEFFLGDLLSQILPPSHYKLQYQFKNGEIVDAIIRLGNGLVPVDSKFPLENFKRFIDSKEEAERKSNRKKFIRDVHARIDEIARKYILPDEGTYEFALMYIPAENVYYETIIKEENEIFSYALGKKVIPVSPNSFYAYLQVIVLGLKGLRIEKNVEEIIRKLGSLQGDFTRFKDDFDTAGKHIANAKNKFDEAERKLAQLGDKLSATSSLKEEEKIPLSS